MDINYNYLRVFLAVAKYGNLTMAANDLLVSQPSVSLTIQKLETSLGCKLFDRLPKGMELTDNGKALYQSVRDGFNLLDEGLAIVSAKRAAKRSALRIAGSQSVICTRILGETLSTLREEHPSMHIRLNGCRMGQALRRLNAGVSDVVFGYTPIAMGNNIEINALQRTDAIFICGEQYKHLAEKPMSFSDLLQYPIISYSGAGQGRFFWDEIFAENGVIPDTEYDVSSTEMMLSAVKMNMGIGVILRQSAEFSLRKKYVYEIKTNIKMPCRDICMIYMKGDHTIPVQKFIDEIKTRANDSEQREAFAAYAEL